MHYGNKNILYSLNILYILIYNVNTILVFQESFRMTNFTRVIITIQWNTKMYLMELAHHQPPPAWSPPPLRSWGQQGETIWMLKMNVHYTWTLTLLLLYLLKQLYILCILLQYIIFISQTMEIYTPFMLNYLSCAWSSG